jgi:hypothetical protein
MFVMEIITVLVFTEDKARLIKPAVTGFGVIFILNSVL